MEICNQVKFRAKNCISYTFVITVLIHTANKNQGTLNQPLVIMKAPCCSLFLYGSPQSNPMSLEAVGCHDNFKREMTTKE